MKTQFFHYKSYILYNLSLVYYGEVCDFFTLRPSDLIKIDLRSYGQLCTDPFI